MEIVVGDIYSSITEPRKHMAALAVIRNMCRARPDGYMYMSKYKRGYWDGFVSVMVGFNKFPTGLLQLVCTELERKGFVFQLSGNFEQLGHDTPKADDLVGITLRDYQLEASTNLMEHMRGVAKMATNSGKTEVMADIIKCLKFPQTLLVLHRKELMYQTQRRLATRLGIKVGMIGDGILEQEDVTIAMIQTLSSKLPCLDLNDNVILMVDECHNASSDQMMEVLMQVPGKYRFGFSGTPLKYDVLRDMKLMAITGKVVVDVSNEFLIANGYSAEPLVKISEINSKKQWKADYHDAYNDLIVNNDVRNQVIRKVIRGEHGTVLILVNYVEHGKILSKMIPGSVFVHGSDSTEFRQLVLQSMKGENGVFIASPIFDEGIDVPSVSCLVLAGAGKSHVKLLQRIGRGMRKKEGDNRLIIYDFIDKSNKHLYNHSVERMDTYAEEGFEVEFI